MPRTEFEERVRRATAGFDAARDPPRVLEVRARARWDADCLVGQATWVVQHDRDRPALLPLPVRRAALRAIRWADGGEAIAGALERGAGDAAWSLLVERRGRQEVELEWSARGRRGPGGWHFDLGSPTSPLARLELDLPDAAEPEVAADQATVSGPRPAGPGRRLWELAHSGRGGIGLFIRTEREPAGGPLVVTQAGRFQFSPTQADATITLDFAAPHGGVTELNVQHDPNLIVHRVRAPDLKSWEAATADVDGRARLRLRFVRPVRAQQVTIDGHTPATPPVPWTCPALTVEGAIAGGETLMLVTPAGVALDDWRPGGFRLTDARTGPDGAQVLSLQSSWSAADVPRLTARVRAAPSDLEVSVQSLWQVEQTGQRLTAKVTVLPRRGPVSALQVTLPADWQVEQVADAAGAVTWSLSARPPGRPVVTVEFARPLAPGQPHELNVDATARLSAGDGIVPFPDVGVAGARTRVSELAVRVSPRWDFAARPGPNALAAEPPGESRYVFRGAPVAGELALRARAARPAVAGTGRARVTPHMISYDYRLTLEPEGGGLGPILLTATAAGAGPWDWRSAGPARVRQVHRLDAVHLAAALAAAAGGPLPAWSAAAVSDAAPWWLVELDRPVTDPLTLELRAAIPAAASTAVALPLWAVVGAASQSHEVTIADPGQVATITAEELQSLPAAEESGRTFGFADRPGRLRVTVGRPPQEAPRITQPRMAVAAGAGERLVCEYRVRVHDWLGGGLPVELPDGATLLAATVADRAVNPRVGVGLVLPMPAGPDVPVVLVYALPAPTPAPVAQWTAPAPRLPTSGAEPRRRWLLPAGITSWGGQPPPPGSRDAIASVPTLVSIAEVATSGPTLWVARTDRMAWWTAAATALLAGGLLAVGPRRWLAVALPAAGLAAWPWLPGPLRTLALAPVLAPLAVIAVTYLARRRAPLAILLLTFGGWMGPAAEPEPITVLIVPGEPDAALVPPTLVERLEAMARQGGPTADAVILTGHLTGVANADTLELEARWSVYAFRPGAVVEIPLAGLRPGAVTLAGQPAFPQVAGDRLAVAVPAAGRAELTVRLTVPVVDRAARLAVPEALVTRLAVTLPTGAELIEVPAGSGRVAVERGQLIAELGPVREISLRWRAAGAPTRGTSAGRFREAYLWDLNGPSARLWGVVHCPPVSAEAAPVTLAVPRDLEVMGVGTQPSERLTGWSLADGPRSRILTLRLEPGGPVSVRMAMVARGPLPAAGPIPLPAVQAPAESLYGCRATTRLLNASDMPAERFETESGDAGAWPFDPAEVQVIRRAAGAAVPLLRLEPVASAAWRGTPEVRWRLHGLRAEVSGTAKMVAVRGPTPVVEWEIPAPVAITEVTGDDVVAWSRFGNRLQIWLDQPREAVRVHWHGAVNRPEPAARFDVPAARLIGATDLAVSVAPAAGWALAAEVTQSLVPVEAPPGSRTLAFRGDGRLYRLTLQPHALNAPAAVRLRTIVDPEDDKFVATTDMTVARQGAPAGFIVTVRAAATDLVELEAVGAMAAERPPADCLRTWVVDPVPNSGDDLRVTVTTRSPAAAAAWSVPVVALDFGELRPPSVEHAITLEPGLIAVSRQGLGEEAARVWRAHGNGWRLVVAAELPTGTPRRLIPFAELTLVRDAAGAWRQCLEAWVDPDRLRRWSVSAPAGARWESAEVDGGALPVPTGLEATLDIPLTGPIRPRQVRLVWVPAPSAGPVPHFRRPQFFRDGQVQEPEQLLWSVADDQVRWQARGYGVRALAQPAADLLRAATLAPLVSLARAPDADVVAAGERARDRAEVALRRAEAAVPGSDDDDLADRVAWLRAALPPRIDGPDPPARGDDIEPVATWTTSGSELPIRVARDWPVEAVARSGLVLVAALTAGWLLRTRGHTPDLAALAGLAWAAAGVPGPWWALVAAAVVLRVARGVDRRPGAQPVVNALTATDDPTPRLTPAR